MIFPIDTESVTRWDRIKNSPFFSVLIGVGCLIVIGGAYFIYWYVTALRAPEGVQYPSQTPNITMPSVSVNTPTQAETEGDRNFRFSNDAFIRRDENICNQITVEQDRIQCQDKIRFSIASDSKKVELCDTIQDESTRITCQNPFFFSDAINTKSADMCQKIQKNDSYKQDCLTRVALAQVQSATGTSISPSQCQNITNEVAKESCLDQVTTKLTNAQYVQAQATNSLDQCAKIEDATLKITCEDQIRLRLAKRDKNVDGCKAIQDEKTKQSCIGATAGANDAQIFVDARKANDEKLCTPIYDGPTRIRCHDTIVITKATIADQVSMCDQVKDTTSKNQCRTLFR